VNELKKARPVVGFSWLGLVLLSSSLMLLIDDRKGIQPVTKNCIIYAGGSLSKLMGNQKCKVQLSVAIS